MSDTPATSFPNPCARHVGVAGPFTCSHCGGHFCIECCYSLPDGTISCHDCYAKNPPAPVASTTPAVTAVPRPVLRMNVSVAETTSHHEESVMPGQGCLQHPKVQGLFTCRFCGARSCVTCDFFFPPDIHACPQCASTSTGGLTPIRRKNMIGGLIAGGIATALMALSFVSMASGQGGKHAELVAGLIFMLVLIGGAVGFGLGLAA